MTITEFNKTKFGSGDKIIYLGQEYPLRAIDFDEALFAYSLEGWQEGDQYSWCRCENAEIVSLTPIQIL